MATGFGVAWQRVRGVLPALDRLEKAVCRYWDDNCDRLAASVTYYAYLSLFPLLLLLGSIMGFVLRDEGSRQERLQGYLSDYIPATLTDRLVQVLSDNAGTTGLLGLAGLVIAGLGWVDTLRESIRAVWHQPSPAGNVVVKKLRAPMRTGSRSPWRSACCSGSTSRPGYSCSRRRGPSPRRVARTSAPLAQRLSCRRRAAPPTNARRLARAGGDCAGRPGCPRCRARTPSTPALRPRRRSRLRL